MFFLKKIGIENNIFDNEHHTYFIELILGKLKTEILINVIY